MPHAIDPELAPAVAAIPVLDFTDLAAARATALLMASASEGPDTAGISVRTIAIPIDDGNGAIDLQIVTPTERSGPLPVIYDLHPGGFCAGSPANVLHRDIELAREVDAIVIAVDYRLAPENPYPAALNDCYAGLVWIAEHAVELGADVDRIAIHGQSGGGGLAAATALLARDRGTPALRFQYLGVPELDDRLNTGSMARFIDTPVWTSNDAALSWGYYLGPGVPGSDEVDRYAAPARATDLSGLPPTYITAMEFDCLRDEGIAYAQRLLDAGVSVELHVFPQTFHASFSVATAEVSQRELAEEVAVLRRALRGVAAASNEQ